MSDATREAFERTIKRLSHAGLDNSPDLVATPQYIASGAYALSFTGTDLDQREVDRALRGLVASYLNGISKIAPKDIPGALHGMVTQACLFGWELAQEEAQGEAHPE
jgi:hypothetical protein